MTRHILNLIAAAGVLILAPHAAIAQTKIVIPPGFEAVEGDVFVAGDTDGFRFQELVPAAWLDDLPSGPSVLTSISFRPDASVQALFDEAYGTLTMRVSTTERVPDGLSLTYAENHGADETIVFDAPWRLTTNNVLAADGVTKEFDIAVNFTTPFSYDPAEGNLLLDVAVVPDAGMTLPDGNTDFIFGNYAVVTGFPEEVTHVSHSGPPQDDATRGFVGGNVLELSFVPEPSTALPSLLGLLMVLTSRRRRNRKSLPLS